MQRGFKKPGFSLRSLIGLPDNSSDRLHKHHNVIRECELMTAVEIFKFPAFTRNDTSCANNMAHFDFGDKSSGTEWCFPLNMVLQKHKL